MENIYFKDNRKWVSGTQGIAADLFGYYVWLKSLYNIWVIKIKPIWFSEQHFKSNCASKNPDRHAFIIQDTKPHAVSKLPKFTMMFDITVQFYSMVSIKYN